MFSKAQSYPESHSRVVKYTQSLQDDIDCVTNVSKEDFLAAISTGKKVIFLYHISSPEELVTLHEVLPTIRNAIREKNTIVAVFSKIVSQKIDDLLIRAGCTEVIPYQVSEKAFTIKFSRYLANLKRDRSDTSDYEIIENKPEKTSGQLEGRNSDQESPMLLRPLSVKQDYWLLRKTPYIHKYKNQWMIEIIGPSPAAGRWRLTQNYDNLFPSADSVWAWGPREPPGTFGKTFDITPLTWVFVGKKPEFNWTIHRWAFVGLEPGLHLVLDGKIIASRFATSSSNQILAAENSNEAKDRFKQILETFEQDYYYKLEQMDRGAISLSLSNPPNLPWFDKQDSKKIPPNAWNTHDLTKEEGKEWGALDGEFDDEAPTSGDRAGHLELEIPLGANAMKECGIHSTINGIDVELLNYSDNEPVVQIAIQTNYRVGSTIEIHVESENLKDRFSFKLEGVVTKADFTEEKKFLTLVKLNPDSYRKIFRIRESIKRRQDEILEFFRRAKGNG
ncbi:MAG: hypothetical protein KGP28_04895 [Bdellovibrionales bacterium]|nr:hypothetical protein [Bdellovibrionales bacterium]